MTADPRRAVDAVWRIESARLIAGLARYVRDVGLAEELAQDALVAALEQWPVEGVPSNPGAWLMAVGKRRAVDQIRRRTTYERKQAELARELVTSYEDDLAAAIDDAETIEDDLLRLVFTACHPVLPAQSRVALTLRLLGGLTTEEIARAYLVPEPTVAQRIVRAKRALAEKRVPYETPVGDELRERLASVLEVVYLIFNEGYAATSGAAWVRPQLCREAMRLGRVLAGLLPAEPEVHGLVALMELHASRLRARVDEHGGPVLLPDQDRSRWDRTLIQHGLGALARAEQLAQRPGPYVLQASIAACHARARTVAETDWVKIAARYTALAHVAPSPVVELNRAVAIGEAFGAEPALDLVDQVAATGTLDDYHLLPSVRGDLLARLGRPDEAVVELRRAAALTRNDRERDLLLARADALAGSVPTAPGT